MFVMYNCIQCTIIHTQVHYTIHYGYRFVKPCYMRYNMHMYFNRYLESNNKCCSYYWVAWTEELFESSKSHLSTNYELDISYSSKLLWSYMQTAHPKLWTFSFNFVHNKIFVYKIANEYKFVWLYFKYLTSLSTYFRKIFYLIIYLYLSLNFW